MKARIWFFLTPLFFLMITVQAQKPDAEKKDAGKKKEVEKENRDFLHKYNIMERIGSGSLANQTSLPTIPAPAPKVQGDVYLYPEFRITTFMLYESAKLVEGHVSRYDIKNNEFDIRTPQGIRVMPGAKVRSLVWVDSVTRQPQYMMNARNFVSADGVPFSGFFEILLDGEMMLMRKTEVIVKEPDFHPALNVGSRDYRIIKKGQLFGARGEVAFPWAGKKQDMAVFEPKVNEIKTFIKQNGLSLQKEDHVRVLVNHFNELMK
jgi:hypothetical protein